MVESVTLMLLLQLRSETAKTFLARTCCCCCWLVWDRSSVDSGRLVKLPELCATGKDASTFWTEEGGVDDRSLLDDEFWISAFGLRSKLEAGRFSTLAEESYDSAASLSVRLEAGSWWAWGRRVSCSVFSLRWKLR